MDLRGSGKKQSSWTSAVIVAAAMAVASSPVMAMEPAPSAEPVPIQRPTPKSPTQSAPATDSATSVAAEPTEPATEPTPTTDPAQPPASTSVAAEPAPSVASGPAYIDLVNEGTALIGQGYPAEAAQRFADAYVAMPIATRVSEDGRNTVAWASTAYQQAESTPQRLEAEQVLLTAFFADLGEARAASRPTAPPDPLEQQLAQRLAFVEQQLAQRDEAPGADELGPIDGPAPAPSPPDRRERAVALTLVGLGGVGLIAGTIMVVTGARAASRAEEQRQMTPLDEASAARRAKTGGVMLASFGALVVSGAVMMLGVGSNRLSSIRERTRLSLSPTGRGLALSGRF